jgi:hypothetical protein
VTAWRLRGDAAAGWLVGRPTAQEHIKLASHLPLENAGLRPATSSRPGVLWSGAPAPGCYSALGFIPHSHLVGADEESCLDDSMHWSSSDAGNTAFKEFLRRGARLNSSQLAMGAFAPPIRSKPPSRIRYYEQAYIMYRSPVSAHAPTFSHIFVQRPSQQSCPHESRVVDQTMELIMCLWMLNLHMICILLRVVAIFSWSCFWTQHQYFT